MVAPAGADAVLMNQLQVKSREYYSEVLGNRLVVVATARDRNALTAVATAVSAANRVAADQATEPVPSYVLGDLVSTSHSVTKDTNTVVAVVIATYEIAPRTY